MKMEISKVGHEVMIDNYPLTIISYAAQALQTDQRSDKGSLVFPLLGLFGETGSLLSEVKKSNAIRHFTKDTPMRLWRSWEMCCGISLL